jgi:predicted TIM-barrel fold metal-dependent hydrolase
LSDLIDGYTTPGRERDTQMTLDDLLRQMDRAGIARAVVAPEDREIVTANQRGNARIRELTQAHGRFIPTCTVNPWLGDEGLVELRRAVDAGARMLVIAPALQGFILTDPLADDLFELAGELGIPVYVHTGPHSAAGPTQLFLVAQRLKQTRFICAHCGSTDYANDMPPLLRSGQENLWFELSFVRPWALPTYASLADESRLIYASGAPRNDLQFELDAFNRVWPIEAHRKVYGANLATLLGEGAR